MACCLMAPSHYLNLCWLIISELWRQSPKGNFTGESLTINYQHLLEHHISKFNFNLPGANNVTEHMRNMSLFFQLIVACCNVYPSIKVCAPKGPIYCDVLWHSTKLSFAGMFSKSITMCLHISSNTYISFSAISDAADALWHGGHLTTNNNQHKELPWLCGHHQSGSKLLE